MQTFLKTCIFCATTVAMGGAFAEVSFNANVEADPTYKASRDNPASDSDTYMGGRIEINALASMAKNGDNFVNAKASLIVPLSSDSKVALDDAWVHFGNSAVDLKLGRQEAVDLFPLGKDTVVESAGVASGYRANRLRGRVDGGRIHSVLGFSAGANLRAELGLITKKSGSGAAHGVRPTLTYNSGPLTLRAGMESFKIEGSSADSLRGFGLSAGYAINANSNVNLNLAKSSRLDASSIGINAVFGPAGLGFIQDKTAGVKENTLYAAYSMPLLGVKGATITPALSHSKGKGSDALTALRLRINYAF